MSSPSDAPLDVFARFCAGALTTEDGKPLQIHDFQRRMLTDLFGGVRETLILVPKKNGKSTLLGALALYHLLTTPDAECIIVAASRDQASIMLRQAARFIRHSPSAKLRDRLVVKQREIVDKELGGRIRILASDADTADGVIPTLVLVDELHRHKTDELYGILRDGLGPRNGQMVTISTAGDSLETPLGVMRRNAYALPGMIREGAYRFVRTDGFALHEWALDEDADVDDMELVKTANPAPWHTLKELQDRHDSTTMRPWQWKRFACGLWVGGEDSAVSDGEWRDAAAKGWTDIPPIAEPIIGLDIARRVDWSAEVAVWRDDDGVFWMEPLALLEPPGDGGYITEDEIWAPIAAAAERWPRFTLVADPALGGDIFLERVEKEFPNARVAIFDQKPHPLARMAAQFTEQLAGGNIRHPDDQRFNAHVLAATQQPVGEGWRFIKQRKKKLPIDGLIAAAMALSVWLGDDEEPEYERAVWPPIKSAPASSASEDRKAIRERKKAARLAQAKARVDKD